ncbi:MAG: bifunctional riboflavin kinase/FAD synthetase [Alphaproteobacteria bacterium]
MRIFHLSDGLPEDARGAALAIGNFDGVHIGHRHVIAETRDIARGLGAPSAVLTFEPHPRRLFAPEAPPFRLSSLDVKARAMDDLGVDLMFVAAFDRAFAAIPAESFIDDILVARLGVRHVVVGDDFCFGHRRQGDVALLRERAAAAGFGVSPAPKVLDSSGAPVSSNTIRTALAAGDTGLAEGLLGRPWEVDGIVVDGDKRGRELGFPTANLDICDYLHPANGVYAVRAGVLEAGGTRWHDGAASFGLRPQFAGTDPRLEVYLLDFSGDLYGKTLRVVFHAFLRGEERFADVAALVAQMHRDVIDARRALSGVPASGNGPATGG